MTSANECYERNELFSEPSLEPLTVRFYEDTGSIIEEIAGDHGLSQAEVVRRLVVVALEEVMDE